MQSLYPTSNPNTIALQLKISEQVLMIWDLIEDVEYIFFDIQHFDDFYRGTRSINGYVKSADNCELNIDDGIGVFLFDRKGNINKTVSIDSLLRLEEGNRIDSKEEFILTTDSLNTKTNYINTLIDSEFFFDKDLAEGEQYDIVVDRMSFMNYGETLLHRSALHYE